MKDALKSADMQMLERGENVSKARSFPGMITIIMTVFCVLNLWFYHTN